MYDPYAPLETPADDPYGNPAVPPAPKAAPAAPATSDYDMTFSEGVDIPDYTPSPPKPEPEPVRPPPAADMTVEEMSKPEPEQAAKPKPVTESQTASAESYTFPEYYADPDDPANKPKVKLTPEQRARRRKKIVVVAAVGALALAVGGYFTFKDKYYQLRLPSIMAEMGLPVASARVVEFGSTLIRLENIKGTGGKWTIRSIEIHKDMGSIERTTEFKKIVVDGLEIDGSPENLMYFGGIADTGRIAWPSERRMRITAAELDLSNIKINLGGGAAVNFNGRGEIAYDGATVEGDFAAVIGEASFNGRHRWHLSPDKGLIDMKISGGTIPATPYSDKGATGSLYIESKGGEIASLVGKLETKGTGGTAAMNVEKKPRIGGLAFGGKLTATAENGTTEIKFDIPVFALTGNIGDLGGDLALGLSVNRADIAGLEMQDVTANLAGGTLQCKAMRCSYSLTKDSDVMAKSFAARALGGDVHGEDLKISIKSAPDVPIFSNLDGSTKGSATLGHGSFSLALPGGYAMASAIGEGTLAYGLGVKLDVLKNATLAASGVEYADGNMKFADGTVEFSLQGDERANLLVKSDNMEMLGDNPWVAPFKLSFQAFPHEGIYGYKFSLVTRDRGAAFMSTGVWDPEARQATMKFKVPLISFDINGLQPEQVFPIVNGYLSDTSGKISARGDVTVDGKGIRGPVTIMFEDVSTDLLGARLKHANGVLYLTGLSPLLSEHGQALHASSVDFGIPLYDVNIGYYFAPNDVLSLDSFTAQVAGGRALLPPGKSLTVILPTGRSSLPEGNITLDLQNIDLSKLAGNLRLRDFSMKGSAYGALNMTLRDGIFRHDNTYLSSGAGWIGWQANAARSAGISDGQNRLSDFVFDRFNAALKGTITGRAILDLHMNGRNPSLGLPVGTLDMGNVGLIIRDYTVVDDTVYPVPADIRDMMTEFVSK